MIARPSLKGRAALAIALLIGFYVLALGIAAGLVYVPYAEWVYAGHFTFRIAGFCLVGAFAILRGVVPRSDRFEPPGPVVKESDQPRLFATIKDVAAKTRQDMPAEIYLVPEVNAFVAQRGGVMGFGSRRVMGIGLPLLESLTVPQFRAVVAHEFGHYYGGDTRLGPWVYKTRASIVRTLQSLSRHSGLLQKPFIWYGKAFSRVTLAISRRQEYVADELAARTYGANNLGQALMVLERSGAAFGAFMQAEFVGVVEAGFRPPLVEGFARFQAAPKVSASLDELVTESIKNGEAGPYNSHPSLKQRLDALSALEKIDSTHSPNDDARAITLVDDVPRLDAAVVASMLKAGAPTPAPIDWDDVPSRVLAAGWARLVQPSLSGLDGLTPAVFPEVASRLKSDPDALVRQLGVPQVGDPEITRQRAERLLAGALAVVLNEVAARSPERVRLWAPPGEMITFRIGDGDQEILIRPFDVIGALQRGTLTMGTWLEQCRLAGIESEDLGACCRRVVEARARVVARALVG
jgi:heat shock protein HtpX